MELQYGLGIAEFIDHLYYRDEATFIIVYGGFLGTGKSSYCIKALAEIYGSHSGHEDNIPDYEAVKDYLVFPPKEFVAHVLRSTKRKKAILWDDMGLWMFALDWYQPFVKATVKYFNVARTDWAAIIGNTPSPKMIVRKLHMFPESIRVKIVKRDRSELGTKPRLAKAYRVWVSSDLKKTGVTTRGMWTDDYNAILPQPFFEWYEPLRRSYAQLAKKLMLNELNKIEKREKEDVVEDAYKDVMPEPERVKELGELVAQRL